MTTIQFLAEWALRSSILILSGGLLLWALRVKDPSVRLAAWTVMLVASLAIPALTAGLPELPALTEVGALRVASGAATTVKVRLPGVPAVPAALVTVQPSTREPTAPAVKVMEVPLVAEVMVPPVMVQA